MNRKGSVANKSNDDEGSAGFIIDDSSVEFKIVRSGNRNLQAANMGSITLLKNPIKDDNGNYTKLTSESFVQSNSNELQVVNGSAVSYADFWNCQCERQLPSIPLNVNNPEELDVEKKNDNVNNPGIVVEKAIVNIPEV